MILAKKSMGGAIGFITVDHDPRTTATDAYQGSLIVYIDAVTPFAKPLYFYKLDDGETTNVEKIITRDNWGATTVPTVTDDVSVGYDAGSEWYNTSTGKVYKCVDPTVSAAVWIALN